MSECPGRPKPAVPGGWLDGIPDQCCWHELRRDTYRSNASLASRDAVAESFALKVERCCFCGCVRGVRLVLRLAEGHGPLAPEQWCLDETFTLIVFTPGVAP